MSKPARPMRRLAHFELVPVKLNTPEPGRYQTVWRFRIRASNGKILAHSEHYRRKRDCLKAITAVRLAYFIKVIR